jgi:hypothetical protein
MRYVITKFILGFFADRTIGIHTRYGWAWKLKTWEWKMPVANVHIRRNNEEQQQEVDTV